MRKYLCYKCGIRTIHNLKNGLCSCGLQVIKLEGKYIDVVDKLFIKYKTQKALREDKENLLAVGVEELRFKNIKVDYLRTLLDEVETLLDNGINTKLIKQVIQNGKEREELDSLIHYNEMKINL